SLDFQIEVVLHSRKINIDDYLRDIEEIASRETNELLKLQSEQYVSFVRDLLGLSNIMEKKIFVVVPYDPVEITPEAVKGGLSKLMGRQPPTLAPKILSEEDFARYHNQLITRQEQVMAGLARLGIATTPLGTEELIEVIHNLYNPIAKEKGALKRFPIAI
ncbi:MAG: hypothetical protein ACK4NX_00905, partial [Candidatus Paceibacteria bacterium]